jgi:DNA mismatch endonuclease (patch repair protein)
MDRVDRATRSRVMASVRATGNRSTEVKLRLFMVRAGLCGWRVQPNELPGRCDFAFDDARLAVFIDGCQWHGCPECYRAPKTNRGYWRQKRSRNRQRDIRVNRLLRQGGWRVLRIWEHDLRERPLAVVGRIRRAVKNR